MGSDAHKAMRGRDACQIAAVTSEQKTNAVTDERPHLQEEGECVADSGYFGT